MENLAEIMKSQAVSFHACKKGLRNFPTTPQGMIDRWKSNLDFAVEADFPSTEVMEEYFERSLLHENLVFVNDHINLSSAPDGVYVLNGKCTGTLYFREWSTATIYVRHESRVNIIAEGSARIFVRVYDSAEANVCEVEDARVKVYYRG